MINDDQNPSNRKTIVYQYFERISASSKSSTSTAASNFASSSLNLSRSSVLSSVLSSTTSHCVIFVSSSVAFVIS